MHRTPGRQGSERQGEQDRGAVGIGNHTVVRKRRIRVDLGHHQRHPVFHAERTGVVHHHSAGGHDRFAPLLGHGSTGRRQHQIHALKSGSRHFLHGEGLTIPLAGLACRARRSQQAQFTDRKAAFLKQLQQLLAYGTAGAEHSHREGSIRQ